MIVDWAREGGVSGFELECDHAGCERTEFIDLRDFRQAIDEARDRGWIVKCQDGVWEHYCCQEHVE